MCIYSTKTCNKSDNKPILYQSSITSVQHCANILPKPLNCCVTRHFNSNLPSGVRTHGLLLTILWMPCTVLLYLQGLRVRNNDFLICNLLMRNAMILCHVGTDTNRVRTIPNTDAQRKVPRVYFSV